MKLTKKLLLLQFSVMLIFIFSACNYESGVMKHCLNIPVVRNILTEQEILWIIINIIM